MTIRDAILLVTTCISVGYKHTGQLWLNFDYGTDPTDFYDGRASIYLVEDDTIVRSWNYKFKEVVVCYFEEHELLAVHPNTRQRLAEAMHLFHDAGLTCERIA